MRDMKETVERFLRTLETYNSIAGGYEPTFRIVWKKGRIEITDATSGFIKMLTKDDRVIMQMGEGVLTVGYFS
jgi:hypothetical protein